MRRLLDLDLALVLVDDRFRILRSHNHQVLSVQKEIIGTLVAQFLY